MLGFQEAGHFEAGGAGIEEDPLVIGDELGGETGDDALGFDVALALGDEGVVAVAGEGGAAVDKVETAVAGEGFQIATDGGFGNVHVNGEVAGRDVLSFEHFGEDPLATLLGCLGHG